MIDWEKYLEYRKQILIARFGRVRQKDIQKSYLVKYIQTLISYWKYSIIQE